MVINHRAESITFSACALIALVGIVLAIATGDSNTPGGRIRAALAQAVQ
ncbi:hypothetical protein [Xanthomonas albilineans]|nr:hypothetical protein [Xanthomonas albilineans]